MGLFDFLTGRKEKRSFDFGPGSGMLFNNSRSGVKVDEKTSVGLTAVWASVRLLSETIASLPLNVYKKEANGSKHVDDSNPINDLISIAPSPNYTSYTWRETMMNSLLLFGNAYACIHRNGGAKPVGLEFLNPKEVEPFISDQDNLIYYNYKGEIKAAAEMLHIVGFSFDGVLGKSPIQACKDAVGIGLASQEFGSNFFGQGANLSGVLEHPGRLSDEAADRLRVSWNERFAGIHNSHQTAILEEGVKFSAIGMPLADAQFIETRRFSVEEVARIFRVPPHMIGDLSRSTYSNIEQQSMDYARYSLQPYLVNWEQELNRKLLSDNERKNLYFKFKTTELLRADANSRADYYRKLFEVGALSPNEIRSMEDMNAIQDGDEHFVPLNLGQVGKKENDLNQNNIKKDGKRKK